MQYRNFAFVFGFALVFASCHVPRQVVSTTNKLVALDHDTVTKTALQMESFIAPYRLEMEHEISAPIGYASQTMELTQPESLLGNFFTDALLNYARNTERIAADIAILNVGGLRKPLNEGEITVRSIYEIMPFDNRVVVVELNGEDLADLFDVFALKGGEAVSGTVNFGIKNGKAINIRINGEPIDITATYRVVTSDYLLEGNDGMTPLKKYRNPVFINTMLRDIFIGYIKQQTAKGEKIQSHLDKRIYVVP